MQMHTMQDVGWVVTSLFLPLLTLWLCANLPTSPTQLQSFGFCCQPLGAKLTNNEKAVCHPCSKGGSRKNERWMWDWIWGRRRGRGDRSRVGWGQEICIMVRVRGLFGWWWKQGWEKTGWVGWFGLAEGETFGLGRMVWWWLWW